ncbi:homogentisate 1,2-dioxygenase, partial [Vibrio natriegens]
KMAERCKDGTHPVYDPCELQYARINDTFLAQQSDNQTWKVKLKARSQLNTITYPYNPLDAQGWKGDLTVFKLNWRDIRPLMSHR